MQIKASSLFNFLDRVAFKNELLLRFSDNNISCVNMDYPKTIICKGSLECNGNEKGEASISDISTFKKIIKKFKDSDIDISFTDSSITFTSGKTKTSMIQLSHDAIDIEEFPLFDFGSSIVVDFSQVKHFIEIFKEPRIIFESKNGRLVIYIYENYKINTTIETDSIYNGKKTTFGSPLIEILQRIPEKVELSIADNGLGKICYDKIEYIFAPVTEE